MSRSYLKPEVPPNSRTVGLYNCLTNSIEKDRLTVHIHDLFRAQVLGPAFPCDLGKQAFARLTYRFGVYDALNDPGTAKDLWEDVSQFVSEQPNIGARPDHYSTFVAVFKMPWPKDEIDFENLLWQTLREMHREDAKNNQWDNHTSSDPNDPNFSYSVSGQSFFIVGIHGQTSRTSRRFAYPAMAFNSHHQFEHLRQTNKFTFFQNNIRNSDTAIQGNINPSLTNYGSDSEAKQYSGRLVPPNWKCPFP